MWELHLLVVDTSQSAGCCADRAAEGTRETISTANLPSQLLLKKKGAVKSNSAQLTIERLSETCAVVRRSGGRTDETLSRPIKHCKNPP